MADLKTNYKDDVLNTEVNERRKYQMIQNDDGTVSFVDVTDYSQVGDSFGALDINATNEKCNELNNSLDKHNHDSRYYTEAEVDTKLGLKADKSNNFGMVYVGEILTSGTWSTISGINVNKPIMIGVVQNSNHFVQSKFVVPQILRNCNAALPFQIFHGANVCTQYYLNGTTLWVFNYTGYKTSVWQ